ncbi:hypothetical protein [Clostridium perfringens]|uniref:hypothetical protein n=1 Tax=Clostridium perfringens TaxID=1502 RepID=UPI0024BC8A2A|nr:hypothetical protein [Clostridium perfringens]
MGVVLSSIIDGEFYGYNDGMLFKLVNGQLWMQSRYKYRYCYSYRPRVDIISENNRFYIKPECMDEKAEVVRVNYIEDYIDGEFNGWEGETIFKLQNGQIWQQDEYDYEYNYEYSPNVLIYDSGCGWRMKVEGIESTIAVKRIG